MALPPLPDIEDVRQIVRCDAATGKLYWLHRPRKYFAVDREYKRFNNRYAGREALPFVTKSGYKRGILLGRHTLTHVVIFALTHGHWPAGQIDHINGDRTDNRPENLRDVTKVENARNTKIHANNSSGRIGVQARGSRWRARIGPGGATILGTFDTIEEASAARLAAEQALGYHANHGRQA